MDDERRRAKRYTLWFPLEFAVEPGEWRLVVARNVSVSGALVVSVIDWTIGSTVTVRFTPPGEAQMRELTGTVVRAEHNDEDSEGVWKHRLAIAFDRTIPELEDVLERVADSFRPPV
jgi:hypothetical protein